MKKIGFIDYYISEWHANNYPAWIKNANAELGFDYEVCYAFAEEYISPVDGVNTDEWCKKMNVERCNTIDELCDKSDVIIILAPSNPEKHLELAQKAFPSGKPMYIDKSFADTTENAKEIFSIAKKYGVRFFSSSALRYATELEEVGECTAITTIGGSGSVEEYIIHQAEMVVKKLGVGAKEIKAQKISDYQYTFTVKYFDERKAGMHFVQGSAPFAVFMNPKDNPNTVYKEIKSSKFDLLIKDILNFFETGELSFNTEEILEVNKIMVAAIKAKNAPDTWVEV